MSNIIAEFQGEYRWLSNFWQCPVKVSGWDFPSAENAYQAAKSLDPDVWQNMMYLPPNKAKRYGRQIEIREDWEEIKLDVMRYILNAKLSMWAAHPEIRASWSQSIMPISKRKVSIHNSSSSTKHRT